MDECLHIELGRGGSGGAGVPPLDAFTGFLHRLRKSFEIQRFVGRKLENEVKIGKSYL